MLVSGLARFLLFDIAPFEKLTAAREEDWGRPPNFLLVDYYNVDGGSVFEVAARFNNVTYNRPCCGLLQSFAPAAFTGLALAAIVVVLFVFATAL